VKRLAVTRVMNIVMSVVMTGAMLVIASAAAVTVSAQAPIPRADAQSRYQIGQMERVLEGAVEHGAALTRDRLKAVLPPGDTVMSGDNAHARGFRLDGYGVFFDVTVPPFDTETTMAWSLRTLDQNDLGLDSALRELRSYVKTAGSTDLEQALKRVEMQMPTTSALPRLAGVAGAAVPVAGARNASGSAATADAQTAGGAAATDPILVDPNEAYRSEVIQALKDAMLDHSASLDIGTNEWLTIAARGNDDRPRLAPADTDSRTRIFRLRGADLAAYLARQITREEAQQRIEVRVF